MKAISPVLPHAVGPVIEQLIAKNQPEYDPLPAVVQKTSASRYGMVTTRWKLTLSERVKILFSGDLWLQILTFDRDLQPVKFLTSEPSDHDCLERAN